MRPQTARLAQAQIQPQQMRQRPLIRILMTAVVRRRVGPRRDQNAHQLRLTFQRRRYQQRTGVHFQIRVRARVQQGDDGCEIGGGFGDFGGESGVLQSLETDGGGSVAAAGADGAGFGFAQVVRVADVASGAVVVPAGDIAVGVRRRGEGGAAGFEDGVVSDGEGDAAVGDARESAAVGFGESDDAGLEGNAVEEVVCRGAAVEVESHHAVALARDLVDPVEFGAVILACQRAAVDRFPLGAAGSPRFKILVALCFALAGAEGVGWVVEGLVQNLASVVVGEIGSAEGLAKGAASVLGCGEGGSDRGDGGVESAVVVSESQKRRVADFCKGDGHADFGGGRGRGDFAGEVGAAVVSAGSAEGFAGSRPLIDAVSGGGFGGKDNAAVDRQGVAVGDGASGGAGFEGSAKGGLRKADGAVFGRLHPGVYFGFAGDDGGFVGCGDGEQRVAGSGAVSRQDDLSGTVGVEGDAPSGGGGGGEGGGAREGEVECVASEVAGGDGVQVSGLGGLDEDGDAVAGAGAEVVFGFGSASGAALVKEFGDFAAGSGEVSEVAIIFEDGEGVSGVAGVGPVVVGGVVVVGEAGAESADEVAEDGDPGGELLVVAGFAGDEDGDGSAVGEGGVWVCSGGDEDADDLGAGEGVGFGGSLPISGAGEDVASVVVGLVGVCAEVQEGDDGGGVGVGFGNFQRQQFACAAGDNGGGGGEGDADVQVVCSAGDVASEDSGKGAAAVSGPFGKESGVRGGGDADGETGVNGRAGSDGDCGFVGRDADDGEGSADDLGVGGIGDGSFGDADGGLGVASALV